MSDLRCAPNRADALNLEGSRVEMLRLTSCLSLVVLMTGCASMSKLSPETAADRRKECQNYANDAASFIGDQQKLGVIFAAVAATAVALGAAVSNDDDGNAWTENRKTILLTSAVPAALFAYTFLNNASSAGESASMASRALVSGNDDAAMWTGCQLARAAYFDGRVAGINGVKQDLPRTPTTQQAKGYSLAAAGLEEEAARAAKLAQERIADAEKMKPVPEGASDPSALEEAKKAKEKVDAAVKEARSAAAEASLAAEEGDVERASDALDRARAAGDEAKSAAEEVKQKAAAYAQ